VGNELSLHPDSLPRKALALIRDFIDRQEVGKVFALETCEKQKEKRAEKDSPSDKEFYPIYVHSCPRCRTPIKSGSNLSLKNTFQNLIFQQETGKIGKIFLFSGRNPEIGDLQKNDPRLAGASASRGSNSTLSAIGIT
jgi:hypothetical protein